MSLNSELTSNCYWCNKDIGEHEIDDLAECLQHTSMELKELMQKVRNDKVTS